MGIKLPEKCLRPSHQRTVVGCSPLAQIRADDRSSYICCGDNGCSNDPYTVCWYNSEVDECSDWDQRDITDTISVLAQALSVKANQENSR